MASSLPKVLHPVAGLSMVNHVCDAASSAGNTDIAVVVGNQAERVGEVVRNHFPDATIHVQAERHGTAHAVLAAREAIERGYDDVVILYGDVPLVRDTTLKEAREALSKGADVIVLGFETDKPHGYGRLIVEDEKLLAIREQTDVSVDENKITYCNSGIIVFNGEHILALLDAVDNANPKQEYYLTDVVEIGRAKGLSVTAITVAEEETLGVNDRVQLAEVEELWQVRKRNEMLRNGVSMQAPHTVQFNYDTRIGRDCVIEANVVFAAGVSIGEGTTIRAFCHLEGATIGNNAVIGPYARLRPGSQLADNIKIGNFVETKNAVVEQGAKINHLSYVGDARVGESANIGAGTITCNYDGVNKHHTDIGKDVFIGTNTSLVAPVRIGDGAMTAAGSVITKDVPPGALAVERSEQKIIDGLASKLRKRNLAIKAAEQKNK